MGMMDAMHAGGGFCVSVRALPTRYWILIDTQLNLDKLCSKLQLSLDLCRRRLRTAMQCKQQLTHENGPEIFTPARAGGSAPRINHEDHKRSMDLVGQRGKQATFAVSRNGDFCLYSLT